MMASHAARDVQSEAMSADLRARIQTCFEAQHETAMAWRSSTVKDRIGRLHRLRDALLAHRTEIAEAGAKDFGRHPIEVELTEVMPVILDIKDTCRRLQRWLKPRKVPTTSVMLGTSAWVRYEPRGRCLIISPWNYPINLTLGPLVPALASGNTAIIKSSEVSPHFSATLVRIIQRAFRPEEVAIFEGDASVAKHLLSLPFDHVFFTGAPEIGKEVMKAASKNLSSVTLELGGKSPTIFEPTADLELAVKTTAWAKFVNSGQTCIAPDHIYVHTSVRKRTEELFKEYLGQLYGSGVASQKSQLTRMINARHSSRVASLLEDARKRGARVVHGGHVDVDSHFIEPTVITDLPPEAGLRREEIFGPVLPLIEYQNISEVISSINESPKPLALYIWCRDDAVTESIIERTSSGGTCINHVGVHFLHHNLPFGGVNNSGMGSYHGEWGIRAFSHERAIVKSRFMLAKMFFPPYTPRMQRLIDLTMRFG